MTPLLQSPVQSFVDANGEPYAGGLLSTYVQGTTTPKATWSDPGGISLNTNPVVLDAAGRCLLYGDGLYRLVLQDAAGNLIWDQPASTLVSAAMAPVVAAPDIPSAVQLLGIQPLIDAQVSAAVSVETAARIAADTAETNARIAADGTEGTARYNADQTLYNDIVAETNRATAAEAALSAQMAGGGLVVTVRTGSGMSDGNGNISVSWTPAFPTAVIQFTCHTSLGAYYSPLLYNATSNSFSGNGVITTVSATGALAQNTWDSSGQSTTVPVPATAFTWFAMGY